MASKTPVFVDRADQRLVFNMVEAAAGQGVALLAARAEAPPQSQRPKPLNFNKQPRASQRPQFRPWPLLIGGEPC